VACRLARIVFAVASLLLILAAQGPAPVWAQLRQAPPLATELELDECRKRFQADPEVADHALDYARALAGRNRIQSRRQAVEVLKTGLKHNPESLDLRVALADLYYRQGFLTLARQQLRKTLDCGPDTGPVYSRLGRLAFRDWLKFQRRDALIVAHSLWEQSTQKNPEDYESWLGLGILALIDREAERAEEAARRCLAIYSSRPIGDEEQLGLFPRGTEGATPDRAGAGPDPRGEALLMLGAAVYEQGKVEQADSAFTAALRYLDPVVRAHLLDISPMATHQDTLRLGRLRGDSAAQQEFLRQFWRASDPDLTTPINEVWLEFLSRGTYAYFLYFDQRRRRWDERGELLVRYGMPKSTRYNPVTMGPRPITTNTLVWSYPSLGMNIFLEDRFLQESYDLPWSLWWDVDPRPLQEAIDMGIRQGRISLAGRGVFRARRPGTQQLPGELRPAFFRRVRRFDPSTGVSRGTQVSRLELYLSVEDMGAARGLQAEAVVFDSTWKELGRTQSVGAAWCGAEEDRVVQFNFDLPAGKYYVGVSAKDEEAGAEVSWRLPIHVSPPLAGKLELSDLELACEFIPDTTGGPFDKSLYAILPTARNEIASGRPLGVYFEIYGLIPDETGYSKLSIEYTVSSAEPDERPFFLKLFNPGNGDPRVQAVHTEQTPGRARFQYVSTELDDPEPGPYTLEIKVTDENSHQVAMKTIDFTVVP
jgi:GWxTD domain-containing protein